MKIPISSISYTKRRKTLRPERKSSKYALRHGRFLFKSAVGDRCYLTSKRILSKFNTHFFSACSDKSIIYSFARFY